MKTIKEAKKKLKCLKKDHMEEQINYLCVQTQCENPELCCYICQQENHKGHEMLSVKILISKIEQLRDMSANVLVLSAELDDHIVNIHKFLYTNRQELTNYSSVVGSFNAFVDIKQKSVLSLLDLPIIFQDLVCLDVLQFQAKFWSFYKQYSQHFQPDPEEQKTNLNIYNRNLKSNIDELKSIQQCLKKLKNENKVTDLEVLAFFPLEEEKVKIFKPRFSEALKGPCMKVTSTTAEMITSGTQRVVALQPSLQTSSRVKKWKIKITKLASWIGVGACHINKLKEANWMFNYSSTQHGSYFISSNGYSWSSFKPEYNSKFEPFTFKTGDVIVLTYNPKQKILKFQKQTQTSTGNPTYSLQIENNGDQLHPAVNLTGLGDAVQIII